MRYRKKPVEIEAYKFTNLVNQVRPQWLLDAVDSGTVTYRGGRDEHLTIDTLEGTMRANIGDFIIKGVKGELYPCKPDIFEASYNPVPVGEKTFTVNGRSYREDYDELTYADVVSLAMPATPDAKPLVTYKGRRNGDLQRAGHLTQGQVLDLEDGMYFTATHTNFA